MRGPLADPAVIALLREKFVCVEEVIPGAETRPEDLAAERRARLEPFSRGGRFFFGTLRILSPDGKEVLGEVRSLPRADEAARRQSVEAFLAAARRVLERRP